MPNIIVKPAMTQLQKVIIDDDGENVTMTIGNSTINIHYADAFKISQMIRVRAKKVKRRLGDFSQHWNAMAIID